jgi:signal transduction histidine kinase
MNLHSPVAADRETILEARRRSTLKLIGLFWLFAFVVLSVRGVLIDTMPFYELAPRRLLTAGFGAMLCLGTAFLLERIKERSFNERVAYAVGGALAMSAMLTLFSIGLNRVMFPIEGARPAKLVESVQWVMVWMGYFLAWTGTHLALTYHWEAQDEQQRNAAMRDLAQEARIAALRYQVNPHFLFNALNAISGLVLEQRNYEAETMLLNLAEFLRSALAPGRGGTIGLEEEIGLQRLYLGLEEARFAERMKVTIEVPNALAEARVPTLILQPLIENAVRHGVDRSEGTTTIRIAALRRGERLSLIVEDDGNGDGRPARRGTGLGLVNVRERLHAHFGESGRLVTRPRVHGGFHVEIEMPLAVGP